MHETKVTGAIKEIVKKSSPDKKATWHCLNIESGGSPAAPKGLPAASKMTFTCILNDKQMNRLKAQMEEVGLTLGRGSKILVRGEQNIDLPTSIITGDMGLVAFQVEAIEAQKLKRDMEEAAAAGQNE